MPIPHDMVKSVAFLLYQQSGEMRLAGTAFFITSYYRARVYLVTARHVIRNVEGASSDGVVYVRINSKSGEAVKVRTEISRWFSDSEASSVDVAVLAWDSSLDSDDLDYRVVPLETIALKSQVPTDEQHKRESIQAVLERKHLGLGDEVVIIGLHRDHYGKAQNLPIVRVGSIAALRDEPVRTKSHGAMDAYLIEYRSIGGLSGAPVFLKNFHYGHLEKEFSWDPVLLGMVHGHWDMAPTVLDFENPLDLGGDRVNTGIGVVVPRDSIYQVLLKHCDLSPC
jgi:Trypsin-like peptidase domain